MHHDLLGAIATAQTKHVLLPNLVELNLTEEEQESLENMDLLVGAKLSSFSLYTTGVIRNEPNDQKLFDALVKKSPFLRSLDVGK